MHMQGSMLKCFKTCLAGKLCNKSTFPKKKSVLAYIQHNDWKSCIFILCHVLSLEMYDRQYTLTNPPSVFKIIYMCQSKLLNY